MTKFILVSHPQTDVWVSGLKSFPDHIGDSLEIWQGGIRSYNESQLDAIKKALFKYDQNDDTKAAFGVGLTYSSDSVCSVMGHHCYSELPTLIVLALCFFLLRCAYSFGSIRRTLGDPGC